MNTVFISRASQPIDALIKELQSSSQQGLTATQVVELLKKYGLNQPHERQIHWWDILFHQVASLFFLLFCTIAVLFMLLGQWSDASIILLLIGINLIIGFYQEYKASRTVKLLRSYIEKTAMVVRDGKKQTIAVHDLVPGDIVLLKQGDIVPADLRLITEDGLVVDESVLTGESAPVKKRVELQEQVTDLFNAFNLVFTGTTVNQGSAIGIVFATGNSSVFGALVERSGYQSWHQSTIEKGVIQLSRIIVLVSIVTLVAIFIANIAIKGYANISIMRLLMFCAALMISIIPEALPLVVIFNLSRSVRHLLGLGVIVKRLSAIEDMGAMEVLCADKTGTLTERNLKLHAVIAPQEQQLLTYTVASLLPQLTGQAGFEGAIEQYITASAPALFSQIPQEYTYHDSVPFDPQHRRTMTLVQEKKSGEYIAIVRGSFENIAALCAQGAADFEKQSKEEGAQARRVLAIAIKRMAQAPQELAHEDQGYTMIGLLSFADPIVKGAAEVIQKAHGLGMRIKIISGDAPEVCAAIATSLHLIESIDQVVTGPMLAAASLEEREKLIDEHAVFARILPNQKAEIVETVKRTKIVGYMGDGLNDLPSLEMAHVAIVVKGCPDVVREAGDIILQKSSLHAVVQGIKEGRTVLANTLKYIQIVLASNFGNFYTIAICSLFIQEVPLLPIQILLLNFLGDFPMITIGTSTPDSKEIQHPHYYNIRQTMTVAVIFGLISSVFDFIFFSYFMRKPEAVLHTGWFIENVVTQMLFIIAMMSHRPLLQSPLPSASLLGSIVAVLGATFFLTYSPIGQQLFLFAPVAVSSLLFIGAISLLFLIAVELVKYGYYRQHRN